MSFVQQYLRETSEIAQRLDYEAINGLVFELVRVRAHHGRLFILGVGGSAANASHAVNDFRKLTGIEAYAPTDNVAELTAITNDLSSEQTFVQWLSTSRLCSKDAILVLSVGGGTATTSANIVAALDFAEKQQAMIFGIVGSPHGETAKRANVCVVIPEVNALHRTPHSETFQAVVWHCLVNHPLLRRSA